MYIGNTINKEDLARICIDHLGMSRQQAFRTIIQRIRTKTAITVAGYVYKPYIVAGEWRFTQVKEQTS